jgi:hypothetical protein
MSDVSWPRAFDEAVRTLLARELRGEGPHLKQGAAVSLLRSATSSHGGSAGNATSTLTASYVEIANYL